MTTLAKNYKRAALAVVIQAIVDAGSKDQEIKEEALDWLAGTGLAWVDCLQPGLFEKVQKLIDAGGQVDEKKFRRSRR